MRDFCFVKKIENDVDNSGQEMRKTIKIEKKILKLLNNQEEQNTKIKVNTLFCQHLYFYFHNHFMNITNDQMYIDIRISRVLSNDYKSMKSSILIWKQKDNKPYSITYIEYENKNIQVSCLSCQIFTACVCSLTLSLIFRQNLRLKFQKLGTKDK